jgi:hypothetical protein
VFGDARELWLAHARDGGVELRPVAPGISVITNDRADEHPFARAERVRALIEPLQAGSWPALRAQLVATLSDHAGERPICLHGDLYGTRSASLVALGPDGVSVYEHAEGPPCSTPFRDVSDCLR